MGEAFREAAARTAERERLIRRWWKERNRLPWWLPNRVLGDVCYPVAWWHDCGPVFRAGALCTIPPNEMIKGPGWATMTLDRPSHLDVGRLRRSQVGGAR